MLENQGSLNDGMTSSQWPQSVKNKLGVTLSLIQFLCNCMFTLLTPFYPVKAKEMGIDVVFVGYVIEAMALTQFISSLVFARLMISWKLERYNMVLFGLVLLVTCEVCLGMLEWVHDIEWFKFFSLAA